MNGRTERSWRGAYLGGILFFTALAWLFRVSLVLGLAIMPVVMHVIMAVRARRAGLAARGTPLGSLYGLVVGRELAAAGLFLLGAAYVALRMGGRPRLAWLELVIGAFLVSYALLVRAVLTQARAAGGPEESGEGHTSTD